jgi:tRNA uridine 5-carboxymethylaminomethyl modification enzyme
MMRFKTGTCPRLKGDTIDFKQMAVEEGDRQPEPFSLRTDKKLKNRVKCFTTYTNKKTHRIILSQRSFNEPSRKNTGKVYSFYPGA